MRARAEKNGYKNGTKFGSLTSQIKYDQRVRGMLLPTPLVVEREHPDRVTALKEAGATQIFSRVNGNSRPNGLIDFMQFYDMLPTPQTQGLKVCDENGKTQFIDLEMLPTPAARDWKGKTNPGVVKEGSGCIYGETLPDTVDRLTKSQDADAGKTSRLSPLFTEEMMGFPLMWTALPFLSESGAPNPSKPTATPSSPK
jgi:hypothetical protein